jgi:lambda family phage tail tape measure protein
MSNIVSTVLVDVVTQGDKEAAEKIENIGVKAAGAIAAVTGFALAMQAGTKEALEFGDGLVETAQRIGVSVEKLQQLQSLAYGLNTDVKSLTDAFESSKQMIGLYELGATKAVKAIGLLGDEVKNAIEQGQSAEDIFLLQVKALSEYTNESERAAVAQRAGLGAMLDMATAYANGTMSIEELKAAMPGATVLTEEQANAASELNDRWDKMAGELKTNVAAAFIELGPVILNITEKLFDAASAIAKFFSAWASGMGVMGSIAVASGDLTKQDVVRQQLAESTERLAKAQKDLDNQGAKSAARPAAESYYQKQAEEVKRLTEQYEKMTAAQKVADDTLKKLNEPAGRPKGAGTLAKDDPEDKPTKPRSGGGTSNLAAELRRQQAEEERYANHSEDVFRRLNDRKLKLVIDSTTSQIAQLQMLMQQEMAMADQTLKDAKLKGDDIVKAEKENAEVKLLIKQKYELKVADLATETEARVQKLVDDSAMAVAESENDKIKAIQLSQQAQIKAINAKYDIELKRANLTADQIVLLEKAKNNEIAAVQRTSAQQTARLAGGYWEQLTQRFSDNMDTQGSLYDQMNKGLVDVTMSTTDQIASGMAKTATGAAVSWKEMGRSIVQTLEEMIAKMLITYAIQQLIGMVSGGGSAAGALNGTNVSSNANFVGPMQPRAGMANGGAFSDGMQFFANGGVVDRTTPFGMANGKTGVMGEAGPEAIMPLARDNTGKLGVRGSGGGGSAINIGAINVSVKGNDKQTPSQQGQLVGEAIKKELRSFVRTEVQDMHRAGNSLNQTKRIG